MGSLVEQKEKVSIGPLEESRKGQGGDLAHISYLFLPMVGFVQR